MLELPLIEALTEFLVAIIQIALIPLALGLFGLL